jgi:MYXO-CTERM domain-containing protein
MAATTPTRSAVAVAVTTGSEVRTLNFAPTNNLADVGGETTFSTLPVPIQTSIPPAGGTPEPTSLAAAAIILVLATHRRRR